MHLPIRTVVIAITAVLTAAPAGAQDARNEIEQKVRAGDRLTVATDGPSEIKGRFVLGRDDGMVLMVGSAEVVVPWTSVEGVRRRRNGVLLGAIIGAGVGVATGLPLASLVENETGEGEKTLTSMIALGIGTGICLDALLSTNRTVYRRYEHFTRIRVQPLRGGAAMTLSVGW